MPASEVVEAAGGSTRVARLIGGPLIKQTVHKWQVVPPEHAPEMAVLSGLTVEQIRPDVYRDPDFTVEDVESGLALKLGEKHRRQWLKKRERERAKREREAA